MVHIYKLLSRAACGNTSRLPGNATLPCTSRGENCPAIIQRENEFLIIGRLLSSKEKDDMLKNVKAGVGEGEQVVSIPQEVFFSAIANIESQVKG